MVLCGMVSMTKHLLRDRGQARTCPVTCLPRAGTSMDVQEPPRPLSRPR